MEEQYELIRDLKRHLNSIEHQLFVSSKFTRTTEMLRKIMESIVTGYEQFFAVAFEVLVGEEGAYVQNVRDRIQLLNEALQMRGVAVDLSEYFLLKRLLMCDFDCIGEYRKNLCMVAYVDGEEYLINMQKLHDFYSSLKSATGGLQQAETIY